MNDGGPAFPRLYSRSDEDGTQGMTLRDYFAAEAMQALCGTSKWADSQEISIKALTHASFEIADAMLRAREGKA